MLYRSIYRKSSIIFVVMLFTFFNAFFSYKESTKKLLLDVPRTLEFHNRPPSMPACGARNITKTISFGQQFYQLHPYIRPFKILISTSTTYLPIFLNWLIFYHNLCGSDMSLLHIICLDKDIEGNLKRYGLKCSFVHYIPDTKQAFNRIWLVRGQVAKDLLASGFDVLMSDSDALWLRNPFYDIEYYLINSDIVGTRATFPEDVQSLLGATLCMGFVYIKASTQILTLWDELIDHMVKLPNPDDQKIINNIMVKMKIKFPNRLQYQKSFTVDQGHFLIYKQLISVTILPQNSYRRICFPKYLRQILANTTILHCVTKAKSQEIKRIAGAKYGLWLLNESALSDPGFGFKTSANFDSFIANLSLGDPNRIIEKKVVISNI